MLTTHVHRFGVLGFPKAHGLQLTDKISTELKDQEAKKRRTNSKFTYILVTDQPQMHSGNRRVCVSVTNAVHKANLQRIKETQNQENHSSARF